MPKLILQTGTWLWIIGGILAVTSFLANELFSDSRSMNVDFRRHELVAAQTVAELHGADELVKGRVEAVERKLDSMDKKLDILLAQRTK